MQKLRRPEQITILGVNRRRKLAEEAQEPVWGILLWLIDHQEHKLWMRHEARATA